jgi:excisionase family DNA binding protein
MRRNHEHPREQAGGRQMAISLERDDYSVPEAAKALGVSPSTVWRWIDARKLPAYRIGARKIRIRREDLAAMVTPARDEIDLNQQPLKPVWQVPWTPEEQTRQQKLVAEILADQEGRSIAPLTTADLIRQVRDEREERYASWSSRSRRVSGDEVAPSGRGRSRTGQ